MPDPDAPGRPQPAPYEATLDRRLIPIIVVFGVLVTILFGHLPSAVDLLSLMPRQLGGTASCEAARISTPAAHEGTCVKLGDRGLVTYNVVDRAHVLQMPEYSVRILDWRAIGTHVNRPFDPSIYPGRRGLLVSFFLAVTNTSRAPLAFGTEGAAGAAGHYPRFRTAELLVRESPVNQQLIGYPAILNGDGAPQPSAFRTIAPHQTVTGWVSFVASPTAISGMRLFHSDLNLSRTDHDPNYVGQIRLWK